jgi:Outer membrane receptor for ferrienterochelin and colicins
MKRIWVIAGCIIVLSISLFTVFNVIALTPSAPKSNINLNVNVVYGYFGNLTNIPALNPNKNIDDHMIAYLVVLSISNNGPQAASLTNFELTVGSEISISNATATNQDGQPAPSSYSGIGIQSNTVIHDVRNVESYPGFDRTLNAGKTRLIAISGIISIYEFENLYFESGRIDVYSGVNAQPVSSNTGGQLFYSLNQIPLKNLPAGYLYDTLQTDAHLSINGLDAVATNYP